MPRKRVRKNTRRRKITRKPQRKSQVLVRQPYVETKMKDSAGAYNLNSGSSLHIPDCFEFMEQGDLNYQITGRWIMSKWLTQKMVIDFTPCVSEPYPMTYTMIHGWCKINLNPDLDDTNPQGPIPVEMDALQTHVSKYLRAAYENPLSFSDKRRFKILSQKYITGNPRIITNDGSGTTENFRQNQYHVFKWTPMRKIRYNHCIAADDTTFMQCNTGNWIPFIFFNQTPTDNDPRNFPQIKYATRHWFTDS